MKIFLIEDDKACRFVIEQQLKMIDPQIEVESFSNLGRAMKRVREFNPNVVLMDLNLEDAAAIETISKIPELAMQFPVIITSVSENKQTIEKAMAAGAQDYVTKMRLAENPSLLMQTIERAQQRFDNARKSLRNDLCAKIDEIGSGVKQLRERNERKL